MMGTTGWLVGGSEPIAISPRFQKMKAWGAELTLAEQVASDQGAEVVISDAAHQVAKIVGPDIRVVVYPHRTTAGNYHLRVRDEASKNKAAAEFLMAALDRAAGLNCTFSRKS